MPDTRDIDTAGDLSTLAWVHDELRRSLEAAHKSLRRHLKELEGRAGSDTDAVDPAVLRHARNQVHQGVGALDLVGLDTAAQMLRATEAAIARLSARPKLMNAQAVATVERGSFALLDYLGRMLAGKPLSPLAMFPQYRALQELAGAARVHPADLWPVDWRWRDATPVGVPAAAPLAADVDTGARVEAETLALMRGLDADAPGRMTGLCDGLAQGAQGHARTLWQLAAAFYEAQAAGVLKPDVYSKRVASRLMALVRAGSAADPSDRLAQDLLFFCAHANTSEVRPAGPRLAAVRAAWQLGVQPALDYESSRLGRFDPAWVSQARKRVAGAKDVWSSVAGGDQQLLPNLAEQFSLVGESITKLYPQGENLAHVLNGAASQTVATAAAPPAELAMEVATCLLYLDASLEDGDLDHAELAGRVQRLAQRIDSVRQGRPGGPLEPWMEELYRRVSDRQTMGSVVQELRSSLSEVEKQIDQYFRDPAQRELLIPVPATLSSMRGVLSVLGLDQASQAVLRMRDDVDVLAQTEVDPQRAHALGTFDRLADNLGALSFLIDMLSVQPQMAKRLFRFDATTGNLEAVMGRSNRPSAFGALEAATIIEPQLAEHAQQVAQAAAAPEPDRISLTMELDSLAREATVANQPVLATAAQQARSALVLASTDAQAAQALSDFVVSVSGALASAPVPLHFTSDFAPASAPAPLPVAPVPAAPASSGLEDDAEMRDIFLEEAREVVQSAHEALARLRERPDGKDDLTSVRRAFHTLKGSSRMVGLADFGDAAWACEQLYNARLADNGPADGDLLGFSEEAMAHLGRWVEAIAAGDTQGFQPQPVVRAADALRKERLRQPIAAVAAALPVELPVDLPAPVPEPVAEPVAEPFAEPVAEPQPDPVPEPVAENAPSDVDFALDLAALDDTPEAPITELLQPSMPMPLSGPEPLPSLPMLLEPVDLLLDAPAPAPEPEPEAPVVEDEAEQFKHVGELRVPIPLFNIYLNEADEQSRRLSTEVAEWGLELQRPVGDAAVSLAHSLAGNSSTVGFADLSQLARALEHALARSHQMGHGTADEARLFADAAEEVRRLLHQFAAGFLRPAEPGLLQRLADHEHQHAQWALQAADAPLSVLGDAPLSVLAEPETTFATQLGSLAVAQFTEFGQPELQALPLALAAAPLKPAAAAARADALDDEDDIDVADAIDADLFPIFEEEALELVPQLHARMRDWAQRPADNALASACMRTLHTLKGGARLAGAMRMGEMAHRMETAIEHLVVRGSAQPADMDRLVHRVDTIDAAFETLRRGEPLVSAPLPLDALAPRSLHGDLREMPAATGPAALPDDDLPTLAAPLVMARQATAVVTAVAPETPATTTAAAAATGAQASGIDWARWAGAGSTAQPLAPREPRQAGTAGAAVRVRAPLLDRLVSHAGEVSITRARIESDVGQLKGSLGDLTENLERLRRQLRDIELQAETQISSRMEAAKALSQNFDPLEMDRFTRFQELTRMMAESVNDVATVQRGLQRTLQSTEDELAAQARLTRDLQDDLLRTRMVEFEGLSERLYRVVRLAAKETAKQVRLDIVGGAIEVDRGVLDRMTPAFEHLLRNAVSHGVEPPAVRTAAGKDAAGQITIGVTQEGNEVAVEFRDDGAGLDMARIRSKAVALGLLAPDAQPADGELANFIFAPGFSTAEAVTELAGRGVGMDVVRNEVSAMGGRVVTATAAGRGTSFRLVLPLTTAVTQVVMLRVGEARVAVPSTLVEIVRRVPAAELEAAYRDQAYAWDGHALPFFWLGALLQTSPRGQVAGRSGAVLVVRSAAQRMALHVDEVLANQEVVVKNLGPQLSRLPGLAGMTLLPSGMPALIYNPVALATLYGDSAWAATRAALAAPAPQQAAAPESQAAQAPLVLVVDDSLTVRRVTQRLLLREGYRVALAKDGLEGLERLAEERPAVLLSDIEMPRMDGFDLVRNLRADPALASLPVVMITSRIAQRHRDHAATLGVNHYLGKPYAEEDLLALVAQYARAAVPA